MIDLIAIAALTAAQLFFFRRRSLRYLRFFQQEQYHRARFLGWVRSHGAWDKRGTLCALTAAGSLYGLNQLPAGRYLSLAVFLFFCAALCLLALTEENPRKAGKLPLVMTERAQRIACAALALFGLVWILAAAPFACCAQGMMTGLWLISIPLYFLTPFLIVAADLVLDPHEKHIQQGFLNEAKDIFRRYHPLTIGITGSYGKTSCKAILGEFLNVCVGPTFYPPKSYNSPMGITRDIRERLRPGHQFAVIEMGAFGIGSIKRLCDLTPPTVGLITHVGIMHLERFGSPENVFQAKSELARAIPRDGILVCNGDNPGARRMAQENPKDTTLLYGTDPSLGHLDCLADEIRFSHEGTSCVIHWRGQKISCLLKLLGRPALSNVLGCFTVACALGADPEAVVAAIRNLEPVENRLSVAKDTNAGVVFLKDAYNSNPVGFSAALEVLAAFPGARKILMTPGMIELGEMQTAENQEIGQQAAKSCDYAILVGETNREALSSGLLRGGMADEKIIRVNSREEAFQKLKELTIPEAVVLIENDLPDLYEMDARF